MANGASPSSTTSGAPTHQKQSWRCSSQLYALRWTRCGNSASPRRNLARIEMFLGEDDEAEDRLTRYRVWVAVVLLDRPFGVPEETIAGSTQGNGPLAVTFAATVRLVSGCE